MRIFDNGMLFSFFVNVKCLLHFYDSASRHRQHITGGIVAIIAAIAAAVVCVFRCRCRQLYNSRQCIVRGIYPYYRPLPPQEERAVIPSPTAYFSRISPTFPTMPGSYYTNQICYQISTVQSDLKLSGFVGLNIGNRRNPGLPRYVIIL